MTIRARAPAAEHVTSFGSAASTQPERAAGEKSVALEAGLLSSVRTDPASDRRDRSAASDIAIVRTLPARDTVAFPAASAEPACASTVTLARTTTAATRHGISLIFLSGRCRGTRSSNAKQMCTSVGLWC
jgi:hypothetical protein